MTAKVYNGSALNASGIINCHVLFDLKCYVCFTMERTCDGAAEAAQCLR